MKYAGAAASRVGSGVTHLWSTSQRDARPCVTARGSEVTNPERPRAPAVSS